MNMDSTSKWKQFEENENSWFSFYSNTENIEHALIFINEKMADDPLLNHASEINCESDNASIVLDRVASRFRRKRISQCFYISPFTSPKNFEEILQNNGFKMWDKLDVMEYSNEPKDLNIENIIIKRVGMESLKSWIRVFSGSFGISLSQIQEYSLRSRILFPRSDIDFYLAFIRGKAVGCATLYSKDSIGGIYFLGTLKEYRDIGVSSIILKAISQRSQERNNNSLILQVLQKDELTKFYKKNGFKKCYSKKIYLLK